METNRYPEQNESAQTVIQSEPVSEPIGEQAGEDTESQPDGAEASQTAPEPQAGESSDLLYDPAEVGQIVGHLTNGIFDPEYILLFGRLAGGTPHSDAAAYDLLMVVRDIPQYDWMQAKRYLRYKMPYFRRKITYINLYILPLQYVRHNPTPFIYFARAEGHLIYCSERYRFLRPRHRADFARALADAKFHFETFRTLGCDLLEQAGNAYTESDNPRLAALFTAQALVYFYHTFYYVYHGMEFDSRDPVVMHDRMRTLSTGLMLAFDDTHTEYVRTLPRMREVLIKTPYDAAFTMPPQELEKHMERVEQAVRIIENLCELRIELYERLAQR